jgi:hypothetical protein
MAHGPIPDKPVSPEEFLMEGLKHRDGSTFRPTETQLRFIREAASSGQRLQREDAEALAANSLRNLESPTQ